MRSAGKGRGSMTPPPLTQKTNHNRLSMHKLLLTFALTALAVPQVIAAPQEIRHIAASSADSLRLPTLNFVEPTTQSPYGQAQLQAPDRKAQAPAVLKKMRPSTGTFTNEPDMPDMFGFNWTYPWTIMQIDEPDMKETHLLSAEDWPVTLYLRNGNLVGTHFQDNPGGATMLHASFNANGYNNWAYTQFISRAEIAKRVLRTAYDPHTDMVYGLSVADAEKKDKFGFVKFYADKRKDPVTGSEKVPLANITVLNDALPAACECSALAWDPRDGNVIGVSVAGQVIRFNTETGKHQVIFDTGKVNSTYFGGLAYSPSHRGFIWCYLVTEEGKTISQDYYLIDTDNRTCKLLKSVGRDADGVIHQVSSLIVNNTYADPLGPVTAKITADNFEPRASSGSLTVEIPSVNEKGQALVGNLTYMLRVDGIQTTDGKSYIEASVAPGSVRTDRIEGLTDGPHRITIYTKTADGHWSRPLHTVKFTGYDTPLMPQNVKLDAEYLTWDPVTEGINGIDITSDGVEYEVWVDEKLVGTTTSTSYRMDFDPVELLSHLAAVYAVNHDKMSYPSFSNRVTVGEYRTVPATFVPEASDVLLSTTVNPEGDSGEWLYNSNYEAW